MICLTVLMITIYCQTPEEVPPTSTGANIDYAPVCYKEVCGSIVTYCLLSGDCRCDVKQNLTCAESCGQCLGNLFTNCCVCASKFITLYLT